MPKTGPAQPLTITKELLVEIGGWRAMKEGRALWESGKVGEVAYEPPLLQGTVQAGTSTVNARLHLGTRLSDVENLCSCRQAREYGTVCAHVIALGLGYLAQNNTGTNGQLSPSTNGTHLLDPLSSPPPPALPLDGLNVHYIPRSEAADTAPLLQISYQLPIHLVESWNSGEMRVICQGSLDGGPWQPIEQFYREELNPYSVPDEDIAVLDLIRRIQAGIPGIWTLTAKYFGEFLTALVAHPRVFYGKREPLEIVRAVQRSTLHLTIQEDGTLKIHQQDPSDHPGTPLQSTTGQWVLSAGRLAKINGLPVSYLRLRQDDMVIARDQIGHFFQHEIPYLERQADLVMDSRCSELEFSKVTPRIRVTLDGLMSGLSAKLEAVYDDKTYVLKGANGFQAVDVDQWKPDPANPLRYFIRDREAEHAAKSTLQASGFSVGKHHPELYTLPTEARVGFFLANVLPRWLRQWEVLYSHRLGGLMDKCDRIEPILDIQSSHNGGDWLSVDIEFREAAGSSTLSHAEVQRLLQVGASHQRLQNGRIALLPIQSVQEFQEVIRDCQVRQSGGGNGSRLDPRFARYFADALESNGWKLKDGCSWNPPTAIQEAGPVPLPPELATLVRPYQQEGVNWLHYLATNGFCGILADEMGLGKTLQTLAYLQFRKNTGLATSPFLVICPTSLVYNWRDEAARFTPGLRTTVLHGAKRAALFPRISESDLVVTSYALMRRDIEIHTAHQFDTIILDEAQHIKNRGSQNAQNAKKLKAGSRLVLTGTPIENSLLDLWSIYDFLMPGYLGPATEFKTRYEIPIGRAGDPAAQERLKRRVRPFILRRTKAEVARDLPDKLEQIAYCELTDEQKQTYQTILDHSRRSIHGMGGENPDQRRMAILTALMRLRQVCCHLGLLPTEEGHEWKEPSAKVDYFKELVRQAIDGNHRILVFSQFVSLLKLLEQVLRERDIEYCYLDGATLNRSDEVKRFQSTPSIPVFLISLKAGGTGMNLTGADTVVHFDPWWNPAVEEQATARAHRIGQTRIVSSYKLIARGTVEEKIVNLQNKKRDLAANTLVSEEAFVRNLTWDELQGLLE